MIYASPFYILAAICFTVAAVRDFKADRKSLALMNAFSAACLLIASSVLVALSR